MAIHIELKQGITPNQFLRTIRSEIGNGHIETWIYDTEGDFIYKAKQWKQFAIIRPYLSKSTISFGVIGFENQDFTREIYSIFQGRFAEMLIEHIANDFTSLRATSYPIPLEDLPFDLG